MSRIFSFILTIGLLMFATPSAHAWGKYGHVTICEISYRLLTEPARARLKVLMAVNEEYTSFNRACLEEDAFPRVRSEEHFLNVPRDQVAITDMSCGAASKCVLSAIQDDFGKLGDTSLDDATRVGALIALGHWVGDVHQPLHISFADDRGGNSVDKRGRCSADNLHSVWDNCIVEDGVFNMNAIERLLGWARFTKAYRAADRLIAELDPASISDWQAAEIWEWADESYQLARAPVTEYCVLKDNSCWYDADREILAPGGEKRTIQMTQAYIDLQTPIAEERMQRAGVRLAHLINLALDPDYAPE